MRLGITEIHEQAIADVAGNVTLVALNHVSAGVLVREEPASLLPDPDDDVPAPASDRVVFETDNARAVLPEHPFATAHVIVEPIEPVASILEVEAPLLSELLAAVQKVAAEIVRQHGHCRIQTDVGKHSGGLRWHVFSPPR